LLIGRYTSLRLGEKAQEIVYALVAAMQFALGVLLAIDQSRQIDPYGPNATPITVESTFPLFRLLQGFLQYAAGRYSIDLGTLYPRIVSVGALPRDDRVWEGEG
jgi:hypothetical protein